MDEREAGSELMRLINGYQISQAIHVAASLGVADLLKDGLRSASEIADSTGANYGAMHRLLHALASAGVLEERADAQFCLTDIGQCLKSDSPQSRAAWARYVGRPYAWHSWGELRHSVMTGEAAFQHIRGTGVWDWRAERPEETAIFDAAMTELSRNAAAAIAEAFDFVRFGCIVDVGGGQGELLANILAKCQQTTGILYDLPHVVAGASQVLQKRGVADRCEIVGGSMFAGLPPGGDAYIFKSVLMDEDDEKVCSLLRSCRSTIGPSGRLVIIERLLAEPNKRDIVLSDMLMLVVTGGRLRSLGEYSSLFGAAGFQMEQAIAGQSPFTLMIGAPA